MDEGPTRLGMTDAELRAGLRAGAVLWDAGRFFEAHEALEVPWQGTKHEKKADTAKDPRRDFFHGLILYAAAYVHWQRGNPVGVARKLADARRVLANAPANPFGIAWSQLRYQIEADLERGAAGTAYAERSTPSLVRALGPDPSE